MSTIKKNRKEVPEHNYDSLSQILAEDYLLRNSEDKIYTHEMFAKMIQDIYKKHAKVDKDVSYGALTNFITKARTYMELNYKKTIVPCRPTGTGWKVANAQEATNYAVRGYIRYLKAGQTVLRRIPLVDRKYLPAAMAAGFRDSREVLVKFAKEGEPLLIAYKQEKK